MSNPAPPAPARLEALDVFRGATVAAMLLVNDPGSWSHIYAPLRHAEWHGWTPTDLIFPFFLFIVGITTHLSLEGGRRRGANDREMTVRIIRRGAIIVLLGLLLNAFPFYTWGEVPGNPDPTFMERVVDRFQRMRFPGVLQRIGVAYVAGALLILRTTLRQQIAITAALLLGYWAAMTLIPVPGTGQRGATLLDQPGMVLSAWLDRQVFGPHLWVQSKTWDPEGLLSTIPAIGTVILGVLAGRLIGSGLPLRQRVGRLAMWGGAGIAAGLVWGMVFPINKPLWTSSYTLFTAGAGAVVLALCLWAIEMRGSRWWTPPFVAYGVNPMIAFVGSGLMARLIYSLLKVQFEGRAVPLQAAIYRVAYEPWLPPEAASLAFAISFVLVWLAILWPLWRRGLIFKV
ncbi:MAG TPA: heparan-alpha-glucosaminide N-acetyltransferase domain-containing protein [Thermoanaerobaculia bacterium]|nr:heparan-alpha-glucosaminide N-acetyltransferase domain-containing protein [Thermoanaerobaculia bacterium]